MQALQPEWEAVAEELRELRDMSQRLENLPAPANEDASEGQIEAVRQHARVCAAIHQQMRDYAYDYAKSIGDTIETYANSEGLTQDAVNNVGRDI